VNRRPDAEGRFLREKVRRASWNGSLAVTPNGKVLNEEPYMEIVIDKGLAAWNSLPEEERRKCDDLGPVDPAYDLAPPEGGLVLEVFIRSLRRDGKGRLYKPAQVELSNAGAMPIEAQAQRDHLWITAAEAASLAPAEAVKGKTWTAPDFLSDRIYRYYLKDTSTCIPGTASTHYRAYSGQLTLTVKDVSAAAMKLEVRGLATGGGPDFQVQGEIEIDRKGTSIRRFDLLAFCETGHVEKGTKAVHPLGIAFQKTEAKRPMDRVPPYFFTLDRWTSHPKILADAYFGPRQ
jgi:hypothetical protein